jgi:hypothetical protein
LIGQILLELFVRLNEILCVLALAEQSVVPRQIDVHDASFQPFPTGGLY